ncbi:MAG: mechanosensitive ion channel family protein [Thiohalocapsa sp.]|uniref:mechanosensitive ion channel family protein n=1 Tax=Thiohalocapsa sp. TaxID=2497641 RepID=UPI0025CBC4B1|nr:mechanosensitive ion channel family protein [Thiohalocapsa sp.]MCG6942910.1 mechanosensitive ion channel family protein [Thiohalocapsa sp.]
MSRLTLCLLACLLLLSPVVASAADADNPPEPVTVADPRIPVDELQLLLKPLPKAQLVVEANAWQDLVQAKSEEIALADIEIRRLNAEAKDAPEGTEPEAEAKEAKTGLLEDVTALREQRTLLLDDFSAVVAALEAKTSPDDADTQAKIRDYRLYASAVRGIHLDVNDAGASWLAIKGWLTSEEGGIRVGLNLLKFFGILLVAWFVSGIFRGLIHRGLKRVRGTSALLEHFLVGSARWVVMAIGLIMALAALEVSIGPLLAALGAAGFILAFALQDSLGNFASGIMILLFKPFDVGDVVDAGGVSGTVASMNLVSTTIKTFDNKQMIVPNNKVWGDVITNASGAVERRVDMEFGIGYDDDIDRAQAILEQIVSAHPLVLEDPAPTIKLSALADSSVKFIVRPWTKTADYWTVFWDITREVKRRFDAEGVGIPYPQRDVHLHIAGGEQALPQLAAPSGGTGRQTPPTRDGGLDDGDAERGA